MLLSQSNGVSVQNEPIQQGDHSTHHIPHSCILPSSPNLGTRVTVIVSSEVLSITGFQGKLEGLAPEGGCM